MYKNALILIKCAAFFNFSVLFLMENNEIHFAIQTRKHLRKIEIKLLSQKIISTYHQVQTYTYQLSQIQKSTKKIVQPTAKHFSMKSIILSIDYLSFTFIACQYLIRSGLNPAQYSNSSSVSSSMILISGKL